MHSNWRSFLDDEKQKEYYKDELKPFVEEEYSAHTVYPAHERILRALELTPLNKVKVVILGQDPYHEPGQAHGLAFSVPDGVEIPPSLGNIFQEIDEEYGCGYPKSGNLERWAKQGVLLLNTVLTVREHEANSHAGHGWETFTDAILKELNEHPLPIVFMLWGAAAQKKEKFLKNPLHLVLKTSHPSPLSVYRGFRGCGHFRKANVFLEEAGSTPIEWFEEVDKPAHDEASIEELIDRLREDVEWAEANIWEIPITLPDHLKHAADIIETVTRNNDRYLLRDDVLHNVLEQMRTSHSEEAMRERILNIQGPKLIVLPKHHDD